MDEAKLTTPATPRTVLACLNAQDALSGAELRAPRTWSAEFAGTGMLVRVRLLSSPRMARKQARKATALTSASAGRYVVFGPVKDADIPGVDAASVVQTLAACLNEVSDSR